MGQRVHEELVAVPRSAVRFPLEIPLPEGFASDIPETWPLVEGQLEFVGGKLLFMPPCADRQQETTADVVMTLGVWRRAHPEFIVAANEAGMVLDGDTRGADAAVWRRSEVGALTGKFRRVPPILAVEVQGELEDEAALRTKARWYVDHDVEVVWLLFPESMRVVVIQRAGEGSFAMGERLPEHDSLPGLCPLVDDLFEQIAQRAAAGGA
jgi:hypothetical protein